MLFVDNTPPLVYCMQGNKQRKMKKKISFRYVAIGERFRTPYSKRAMTCIRVDALKAEDGRIKNAEILLDHTGNQAEDSGTLISFQQDQYVEVDR